MMNERESQHHEWWKREQWEKICNIIDEARSIPIERKAVTQLFSGDHPVSEAITQTFLTYAFGPDPYEKQRALQKIQELFRLKGKLALLTACIGFELISAGIQLRSALIRNSQQIVDLLDKNIEYDEVVRILGKDIRPILVCGLLGKIGDAFAKETLEQWQKHMKNNDLFATYPFWNLSKMEIQLFHSKVELSLAEIQIRQIMKVVDKHYDLIGNHQGKAFMLRMISVGKIEESDNADQMLAFL